MLYCAAAIAVYAPALNGGWLWDDQENLAGSPIVKAAHPFQLIWSGRVLLDYYPIKDSLQWIQWQLWGDLPLGYHLTNVALLILSALLLWRLLERLGLRSLWAWVGGLLFAVHPVAVGSVAWVSEFKDTLSLPPLLAAALYYLDFDGWSAVSPTRLRSDRDRDQMRARPSALGTPRSTSLMLSLAWFVVAMLCKSSVMMFPVCLLLYGWWARRPLRAVLVSALPFFAVSAACGLVAVEFQTHRAIAADGTGLGGVAFRLSLAARALNDYLGHALWPHDLAPVYFRWTVAGYAGWLPILALGGGLYWLKDTGGRVALLGLGWFVINLVPVLGVVGLAYMRFSWVMDHLAYTSMVGLTGLAAAGLQALSDRAPGRPGGQQLAKDLPSDDGDAEGTAQLRADAPAQWLAGGVAGLAALTLAVWARAYSSAYAGPEAMWSYTIVHQPRQWVGFDNLAAIRIGQDRVPEAEQLLRQALALNPDAPDSHLNLAIVQNQLHHPEIAEGEARQALKLRPDFAPAEVELGTYLAEQGKLAESVPHWQAAIRLLPPSADLHNRYALVLLYLGQSDAGLAELKQALAVDPNWGPAEFSWASVLTQQGKAQEALPHYERAARLLPNDPTIQQQAALARSRAAAR